MVEDSGYFFREFECYMGYGVESGFEVFDEFLYYNIFHLRYIYLNLLKYYNNNNILQINNQPKIIYIYKKLSTHQERKCKNNKLALSQNPLIKK